MKPPQTINVLTKKGGFTAEMKYFGLFFSRPARLLTHGYIGVLDAYDEHSFCKKYSDCTQAYYRVPGYARRAVVWFDNRTGERVL